MRYFFEIKKPRWIFGRVRIWTLIWGTASGIFYQFTISKSYQLLLFLIWPRHHDINFYIQVVVIDGHVNYGKKLVCWLNGFNECKSMDKKWIADVKYKDLVISLFSSINLWFYSETLKLKYY